jgi:hypothetical protein
MNPSDCGGHPLNHPSLADYLTFRFVVLGDWDSYIIARWPTDA